MRKTWFRRPFVLLLSLSIALSLIWLSQQEPSETENINTESAPPLLILEQGKYYRYQKNGNRLAELDFSKATHYQNPDYTELEQPQLRLYKNNYQILITGEKAQQKQLDDPIELKGNAQATRIETQNQEETLHYQSQTLIYNPQTQTLQSPEQTTLQSKESHTQANQALWQLEENLFILKGNIRSQYARSN